MEKKVLINKKFKNVPELAGVCYKFVAKNPHAACGMKATFFDLT